ncbi:MAG: GldG family protein [Verrucomicrobiota bacterium]
MATEPSTRPSFSPGRKWRIAFSVAVMTVSVLAVAVMLNYLSTQVFRRYYLSSLTRIELSPRTTSLLRSMTNHVQITVYCSREESFFGDLANLLREYTSVNPGLGVRYIDYDREPGAAEEFKLRYNLGTSTNKNLIVFECEGRIKTVLGDTLVQNQLIQDQSDTPGQMQLRKKPINFLGEMLFTGALIGVTNPKPLKAYFLEGHGEHHPDRVEDPMGYSKFAKILQQNSVEVTNLTLLAGATVPDDCSLLVIAGPKDPIPPVELARIEKYLSEGGRLLVLFNVLSVERTTGLEKILAKWGVNVTSGIVKDPDYSSPPEGLDVVAFNFRVKHPLVNSLLGSRLQLIMPREVNAIDLSTAQPDNGLKAEEIVFSGPRSILSNGGMTQRPGVKPLMVAVEKSAPKGVAAERGATRILVSGDSLFLGNERIESAANRDFVHLAANWLLDRPVLLEGVGPKPVSEYKLVVTSVELQTIQLVLLAAIPGGVLLLGGLVWLRRRK